MCSCAPVSFDSCSSFSYSTVPYNLWGHTTVAFSSFSISWWRSLSSELKEWDRYPTWQNQAAMSKSAIRKGGASWALPVLGLEGTWVHCPRTKRTWHNFCKPRAWRNVTAGQKDNIKLLLGMEREDFCSGISLRLSTRHCWRYSSEKHHRYQTSPFTQRLIHCFKFASSFLSSGWCWAYGTKLNWNSRDLI